MIHLHFNEGRITGYLAKPVEVNTINSEKKVARLTIIQNERYKNRQGEACERKIVVDLELWGPSVDNLARLANTGTGLYVEYKLKTSFWKDKETQQQRQRLVLEVTSWRFAEAKKTDANEAPQSEPELEPAGQPQAGVQGDDEPPF